MEIFGLISIGSPETNEFYSLQVKLMQKHLKGNTIPDLVTRLAFEKEMIIKYLEV